MNTIIYIDDDLDDIAVFQEAIAEINPSLVVQAFSNSQDAIDYLQEGILRPDIIFLDINMPVMSGKQTLLLIRRDKSLADVPVIMYSTTIHREDRNSFLELGANEFLKKAYHFEEIKEQVGAVLQNFINKSST